MDPELGVFFVRFRAWAWGSAALSGPFEDADSALDSPSDCRLLSIYLPIYLYIYISLSLSLSMSTYLRI